MAWPLVKLIPKKTHFGFVRFAFFASFVSIALVLASFGSMISAGYRESPITLYEQASGSPLDRVGAVLNRGFNNAKSGVVGVAAKQSYTIFASNNRSTI